MMNQSIPLRTNVASAILCLTLFASCSAEDDTSATLPEGKYPMTFATAMEGLTQTRATTDNTWTGNEKIAVQVDGEAEVKEYTAAVGGRLSADDPFYWSNSQETKTVTAWYCGDGTTAAGEGNATQVPTEWTVQTNQAGDDDYAKSDFLYASAKIPFAERETKSLLFYHQTARVVINIKNAEAATDASDIVSVVIGNADNLALSGKYTAPTAGGTVGTWDTSSGSSPQMGTIIPKEITNGSYLKSYAALVIPQIMTYQKFIAVELTNGNTYYYTPNIGATGVEEANLQSGKQYTYNITVKHGYLQVEASSGGAWGDGGSEPVTSKELQPGFSAADLKIGDYYYSDGSISDGGYRKYGDGSTAHLDVYPIGGKTVIGIVCSTDIDRIGEAAKNALSDSPRGLVMALTNASDACRWGNFGTDENSGGVAGEPFQDNTTTLKKQYNNVDGYGETHWILNTYKSNGTTLMDTYTAFFHASRYGTAEGGTPQYAAPANTTGWFIPSMGQWWDILSNLGEIDLNAYRDSGNSYTYISGAAPRAVNNMNKYLGKIEGTTMFSTGTYFWSSSEFSSNSACNVGFYSSGSLDLSINDKNYSGDKVRCVFAF